ncbi:MAG TPA: DUF466 domain-containing protein [Gemmatimonas aurantiaca]|uniref:DUF466 domain-containing protein n=1 Tax=Gemmatimonas aurantiaca TaxID=173480 RepID=A0A3D4VBG1_9BACT|nr:YbdD/YjiX family protein [Gemmatimonas aurantiaca]HCT58469.1 DUF466 domain-containing protein [Gemmatimonas aurantiaca]
MSTGQSVGASLPGVSSSDHVNETSLSAFARVRHALQRVAAVVRRIIGVPDYETYLDHMRRQYPECTPLDATAFERERMADRYTRPGTRCC